MNDLEVYANEEQLTRAAAELIARLAEEAIAARGRGTVALAGGSTPVPIYAALARAEFSRRLDWSRLHFFWGDERCVPPDDARSNYLMARRALLDPVQVPPENIHRIRGEAEPAVAAADYARELQNVFGGDAERGGPPPAGFDIVLLGMGDNAHTASLFPGLAAVTEETRWVMAQYVEVVSMWRVTLTPVIINAARNVIFLVAGEKKAEPLQKVLAGPREPVVLPAQAINPTHGRLRWLVDQAAAARLKRA